MEHGGKYHYWVNYSFRGDNAQQLAESSRKWTEQRDISSRCTLHSNFNTTWNQTLGWFFVFAFQMWAKHMHLRLNLHWPLQERLRPEGTVYLFILFFHRCELAGYVEIVFQRGDEPSAQRSFGASSSSDGKIKLMLIFFLFIFTSTLKVPRRWKKKQCNNALSEGEDLVTIWGGRGLFFFYFSEKTSIISRCLSNDVLLTDAAMAVVSEEIMTTSNCIDLTNAVKPNSFFFNFIF